MVCVSVFYPNEPGKKFDHDYYAAKHMPLVMDRLKNNGMVRYEIDRGIGGGAAGAPPPFICVGRLYFNSIEEFQSGLTASGSEILADVPNYTDISFQLQVSNTTAS